MPPSRNVTLRPPTTKTRPSGKSVAVWRARPMVIDAAGDQTLVVGSQSSALANEFDGKETSSPPTTSTFPFGSRVAVWSSRVVIMVPAGIHRFVLGLYSSALAGAV